MLKSLHWTLHYDEDPFGSCSTTRKPIDPEVRRGPLGEGEVQAVPELEELVHRQASAAQHAWVGMSLLLAERVVRIWDAACMKALQKDVDDKEAERETLLYVGYIRHVCTTILSIPRMQIYTIYISICMSCSLATAIARYRTVPTFSHSQQENKNPRKLKI